MARPLIAVPSHPRIAQGKIKGWNADNVGVPVTHAHDFRAS